MVEGAIDLRRAHSRDLGADTERARGSALREPYRYDCGGKVWIRGCSGDRLEVFRVDCRAVFHLARVRAGLLLWPRCRGAALVLDHAWIAHRRGIVAGGVVWISCLPSLFQQL